MSVLVKVSEFISIVPSNIFNQFISNGVHQEMLKRVILTMKSSNII